MKGRGDVNTKFFQNNSNKANLKSLSNVCKEGRCNGNLNLSNRSLQEFPMIIFNDKLEEDEKFWEITPYQKLDLSFNHISVLPLEMLSLTELIVLKIRNNNLIQLPNGIFRDIQRLNHLDLSFNKIEILDESLSHCSSLKELLINNNKLVDIPMSIAKCNSLTLLDAQDNMIRRLPNICFLCLTSINLSNNSLTELPEEFSCMISLKSIELRKNKICLVPSMNKLTQLSYLDFTENFLTQVPVLPTNGSLQRLYLGFNRLKAIGSLVNVKTLSEVKVNNNMIDECPNLQGLDLLKMLDLSNNSINDIHHSLGFLPELLKLILDGNPIRSIRRTLISGSTHDLKAFLRTRVKEEDTTEVESSQANVKIIVSNKVTHITVENYKYLVENRIRDSENRCVDLSKKNDSDLSIDDEKLDKYIYDCVMKSHYYDHNNHILTIISLSLEGSSLTAQSLSSAFFQSLPLLKSLNLRGNQLGVNHTVFRNSNASNMGSYFPSSLLHLDISSNNIHDNILDQFLSGLNLERLYVANNNISIIPLSLQAHNKMKEIDFSMNQIKNINFEWSRLSLLESIDLSSNKIDSIESLINSMLSSLLLSNSNTILPLRTLKLDNNNISSLPVTLGLKAFDNIREIGLHGNAIKSIPFSTIQRGSDKIREVLRNRL